MQEPIADRRIVSKGEYVHAQADRAGSVLVGGGCLLGGVFFAMFAVFLLACSIIGLIKLQLFPASESNFSGSFFGFLVCSPIAYALFKCGASSIVRADVDPGVPLTRANTADLPAPDTLVRASQEPAQAQEGILLRAAVGETRNEQKAELLRASVGGQE